MEQPYFISTDKALLQVDVITNFLSLEAYWALGRSKEQVAKSIEHSMCFGVYTHEKIQVGFARVVTDYTIFAWLMDVFILEKYRGNNLGKMLMAEITNHPELLGIRRWGLGTKDAHGLYKQFGFGSLASPERMMEKVSAKY